MCNYTREELRGGGAERTGCGGSRGLEEEERGGGETGAGHEVGGRKRPGTWDWTWPVTRAVAPGQ